MRIINPATEEVIQEIAEDTPETITEKYELVKKGQKDWAAVPLEKRINAIEKFYSLLDERKDELAATLTREVGKPLQQSYNEINGARKRIEYFIRNSARWLADEWITEEDATREKIVYEPLGIIANISAWNYPYLVGVNVVIPALIGGNGVLYKPSEFSTLTGLHIQRLLYLAGIPEDVFEIVIGKGAAGKALLDLPLNGYFFTGSYNTGKYIAEQTARKMVSVQLELGGKDPLYVMDDIDDVNAVAAAALEGAVYNTGQSCCAVERIYVQEKIYDHFVDAFTAQAKKLVMGNPTDKTTEIGPVSRKEQLALLEAQVEDARKQGGRVLVGGHRREGKGYFFEPTVVADANHNMKLMMEESFGPVIGIQKVKDDNEAVEMMKDTPYGLTAAVYSKNQARAEAVMKQMNTGTVYWNCCDRVSAALPWSGRKNSGLGATLSYIGIRAFVQPKAYHLRG
ncbi:MAG: aldehyde dehydrogenase family protein [Bacteroidetes bacterium]|nr:aldehyde dehydrogenase family protein [Bacteroidota bacterium]